MAKNHPPNTMPAPPADPTRQPVHTPQPERQTEPIAPPHQIPVHNPAHQNPPTPTRKS